MKNKIEFIHIKSSEVLKKFIEKKISTLNRRFDESIRKNVSAIIKLTEEARSSTGKLKEIKAEFLLKIPGSHKLLVVKKKGQNIKAAIEEAVDALEKTVRRFTEKKETLKKRRSKKTPL